MLPQHHALNACTCAPMATRDALVCLQEFSLKLMEVVNESGGDFVWVHDYHLLVLPSLLRSKFNKVSSATRMLQHHDA